MGHLPVSHVLNVALAVALIVLAYAKTGTESYADALDAESRAKTERVARAKRADPARIWSQRCERQGKDVFATRADGKPWEIRCVTRQVLDLPPAGVTSTTSTTRGG